MAKHCHHGPCLLAPTVQGNQSYSFAKSLEIFGVNGLLGLIVKGEEVEFVAAAEVLDLVEGTDLVTLVGWIGEPMS